MINLESMRYSIELSEEKSYRISLFDGRREKLKVFSSIDARPMIFILIEMLNLSSLSNTFHLLRIIWINK